MDVGVGVGDMTEEDRIIFSMKKIKKYCSSSDPSARRDLCDGFSSDKMASHFDKVASSFK